MTNHELLIDGPERRRNGIVLAHGAGAAMDSDFMNSLAAALADLRLRVFRFEFPYMAERRQTGNKKAPNPPKRLLECWREVIAQIGDPEDLVIGGKSMGGRMASMLADDLAVRGLVCLGYPFHPSGRPDRLRTAHLATLDTPTLIVQGERDTLGTREEIATYDLSDSIRFAWMPDGDHSFKPRVKSGHTLAENLAGCVSRVAEFVAGL